MATGLNCGELELDEDEAICRSIDAADSSSGVGARYTCAWAWACPYVLTGAFPCAFADIPTGTDEVVVEEEDEDEEAGPRLRKGTCVGACEDDLIGSKACVEEGGEGR